MAEKLQLGNAVKCKTLDELLTNSDVVTLHIDGRPDNQDFFGAREFALMKPGALFLNNARGHVVSVPALAAALRSGHLGGAAVDVFPHEPKPTRPSARRTTLAAPGCGGRRTRLCTIIP